MTEPDRRHSPTPLRRAPALQDAPPAAETPSSRVVADLRGLLSLRLTRSGDRTRVAVTGEIDLGCAPMLEQVLDEVLRDSPGGVELDLGGVEFIDCAGLNAVLRARSAAELSGAGFAVSAVGPAVERLLVLTGARALLLPDPCDAPAPVQPPALRLLPPRTGRPRTRRTAV